LLALLGYEVIPQGLYGEGIRTAGIDGSHGVWVGDSCNGLTLFALFAGFVFAFPGPVIKKLWFIPAGLVAIHLLNVLRVTALALIQYYAPQYLEFNHTYTFTIIVYGFVFALWYLWATKLSLR
jgi:exosortase family protein XrtF